MKRIKHFGILLIIFYMCIYMSAGITAQAAGTSADRESRVVRVACGMNGALYLDEEGNPKGSLLYYIRQLGWNENWTIEYVNGSYNENLQNLLDGKVDLMFPVGKDEDAAGNLGYADYELGYQQIGLFAKADARIYLDDYEGFNGKRVGLSPGSNQEILDEYAKQHGFTYVAVPLNTIDDKIAALEDGSVDMIAFSTLNDVPNGKLVATLKQIPVYICTRADDTELLEALNRSIQTSMRNTPDVVSDAFHGILAGNTQVSFTKEENEKIEGAEEVVFGVYKDRLPLAGLNKSGECVGIYVDALQQIAKQTGLTIKIYPVEDENRLYQYMEDGTVDFVIGAEPLRFYSENADEYLASNSIGEYTEVAVTMPDYQFDGDEAPSFILTKDRNYLEEYIYTEFPSAKITYVDTRKECLEQVQSKAMDATFLNTWEYNYETKNPRFQELMEWESMRISSAFCLGGTRHSDLELLGILEKGISQTTSDSIPDIVSANTNIPYQHYTLRDHIYQLRGAILFVVVILVIVAIFIRILSRGKRRYIKELEVANRTKNDFLSRMSHELRTPLNAIDGYASLIFKNAEDNTFKAEEVKGYTTSIRRASEYLLGVIKDILDVQRMETGKVTIEKKFTQPHEYMDAVVNMVMPMAKDKHIDFTYDMINGGNYNYMMDHLRVQQVLFNILYNAVKFTPEGGKVKMTSQVEPLGNHRVKVTWVITDTGIGMSKEFMETKLFTKFAQENEDLTSPYAGCGNGLAISKNLATLMDGDITCKSEQGKGTEFTFTMVTEYEEAAGTTAVEETKVIETAEDTASTAAVEETKVSETAEGNKPSKPAKQTYDLGGLRVLMCEDNKMNQDMECMILRKMNCVVEVAEDGAEGLRKFKESQDGYYDVVLMDIRMPNMDGHEATKAIRHLARLDARKVPIIAVSANAFPEDINASLVAGMDEHLSKPVDAVNLYNKIKEYCIDNKVKETQNG